jgi:hypothetical protein
LREEDSMKIVSIHITGKDSQVVYYNDDDGNRQSMDTPLIEEDGILLDWMRANIDTSIETRDEILAEVVEDPKNEELETPVVIDDDSEVVEGKPEEEQEKTE